MNILTVTPLFPGNKTPGDGLFVQERQINLPGEVDVTVTRMRPWFPGASIFLRHLTDDVPTLEDVKGMQVHDLRYGYIPRFFKQVDGRGLAKSLVRFVSQHEKNFDLLDAHFAYPTGFGAWCAGRELGIPVCITLRGTIRSYTDNPRLEAMKEALRGASKVISVSADLAAFARDLAGNDLDIRVIPNGVDRKKFQSGDRDEARRRLGLSHTGPLILTVGGLVKRKGVSRVLDVMNDVIAAHPDLLYVVIGGGSVEGDDSEEMRRRIQKFRLQGRVELKGPMSHELLPDWYRAADLFVLASSNEGWPNVLQESLACGTPVLATDIGGNREVVGDSGGGVLVPLGNREALRDGIIESLSRTWDDVAIADFGQKRDWRDVGREVCEVYREVLLEQ